MSNNASLLDFLTLESIIKLVYTGAPVIKKNSRKIMYKILRGRRVPFIGKSDKLIAAESTLTARMIEDKQEANLKKITSPVHVIFSFYMPTRRKVDLSNLYQLPEDCLEKAGILENDTLIESHDGSRKFYDKENPRTEIELRYFDTKSES